MKFGTHVSISGGIDKSPQRAYALGCECFQIFTRSPRGGKPPELTDELLKHLFEEVNKYGFKEYYVHTPYFINLASKEDRLRNNSIRLIKEDLERSSILKVKYIMTHLGSSKDIPRKKAVNNVINSVLKILDNSNSYTKLLLENTAGQGDTIGDIFEELAEILDGVDNEDLGICLDTAHMFAAGYDIRDEDSLNQSLKVVEDTIGLNRIKLIHGNDSKIPLGERKDRHEHIGEGEIGLEGFGALVNNDKLKDLNMIVEIPPEEVERDINLLKELRDNK